MITITNLSHESPYQVFKEKYDAAINANQKNIEAICISSYSRNKKEVNSRYVNLKFLDSKEFIFFSNYNSNKAQDFISHNQITGIFFWNNINVQIRMKGIIKKTDIEFNKNYFANRDKAKNALAISSNQSKPIDSYAEVRQNYDNALKTENLIKCPEYWGGFSFTPYYFEFWKGHDSRINERVVYELINDLWSYKYLQP
ncbi:pyridoxal 5'-phosphate synthase [Gammaproteobacteria bacterium]|nr:pyridoxal 5'-phosphate synthase [Gammaproteobacteria bacterium]